MKHRHPILIPGVSNLAWILHCKQQTLSNKPTRQHTRRGWVYKLNLKAALWSLVLFSSSLVVCLDHGCRKQVQFAIKIHSSLLHRIGYCRNRLSHYLLTLSRLNCIHLCQRPLSAPGPKWAENSGHVRKEKLRLAGTTGADARVRTFFFTDAIASLPAHLSDSELTQIIMKVGSSNRGQLRQLFVNNFYKL